MNDFLSKSPKYSIPDLSSDNAKCCGCFACYSICPKKAISMKIDGEGFYYPVIDEEVCVKCNKCINTCNFKKEHIPHSEDTLVYAVKHKEKNILVNSSSGAAFTGLSDIILEQGGAIACSMFDYKVKIPKFVIASEKKQRDLARGSIYVQSYIGDIFLDAYGWIINNPDKDLLFIGTGCQTAGFREFIENIDKNYLNKVYFVDIICHGAPSPQFWTQYCTYLERRYKGEITYVTFKDKRNGWNRPTAAVKIGQNKEIMLKDYIKIYYEHCVLRPACYHCPYTNLERNTDITIGDYWGIEKVNPEFHSEKGCSLILIHTLRGKELFEKTKKVFDVWDSDIKSCLQPNLCHPTECPQNRKVFWDDYECKGLEYVLDKYGKDKFIVRVKRKIKRLFSD
ncbi:Coenzyme F420 hydrogenase/dehydrogenase, beta subunit C-terminal domain [Acetivibrio mesophilus]|uniref:4Fe-4S ferredoxin-type domain-containing protein n=1 Tax=Acetivibrio mesophilus TaxID=2487273 RepID=A0A4Q0I3C4_9FIRM|nr:Coenzyme F420 hydrogenase/dehydrogenase, beta subunit C-terminal domain [Acetivibrio mesophilus]RXE58681.1 hypothetical protein EFD62_10945 [Acetivibrio mesophilus]